MTGTVQNQSENVPDSNTSQNTTTESEVSSATTEADLTSNQTDLADLDDADDGDLASEESKSAEDKAAETSAAKAGEKKKEEPEDPFKDFRGPPESGEYEDYILPDGATADPELKAEFDPLVRELGLSQKGAQRLVEFKSKLDQAQLKLWNDHLNELSKKAKADPEIGGIRYNESMNAARRVVGQFGNENFRKMLRETGVARHPEMIRFLANIAKRTGETPALGEGGGAVTEKPLHELLYGSTMKKEI